MYTEVRLPKAQRPAFPHLCVACRGRPTTTYRAHTLAIGWWTALFLPGDHHAVEVPACANCHRRMRRQRIVRFVITCGFIAAGVALASHLLGGTGGLRRWLAGAIAMAACAPWLLWQALFPRPFDITAYTDHVEYEFADEAYARAFAELNGARVG